jgi:lipopolysaccharide biosynthesis regulator YciM
MERFYSRVIQSRPERPDAYLALAGFYERKGEFNEAIRVLESGLEKVPDNLGLARLFIRLLARAGQTQRLVDFTVNLADRLMQRARIWKCRACGQAGEDFHFRCPACHAWDTLERPGEK